MSNESLTKNERDFINRMFNLEVDTKSLTKSFNKNAHKKLHAEYKPDEDRIIFYGDAFDTDDFVEMPSMLQFAMFMHEVTHAWQFQNGEPNDDLNNDIYEYNLTKDSSFEDFGIEQQASIIEDYAAAFLHPYEIVENQSSENQNWDPELLKKVVETQFPNAREMREAIEEMDATLQMRYKVPAATLQCT